MGLAATAIVAAALFSVVTKQSPRSYYVWDEAAMYEQMNKQRAEASEAVNKGQVYQNQQLGFSVKYPNGWFAYGNKNDANAVILSNVEKFTPIDKLDTSALKNETMFVIRFLKNKNPERLELRKWYGEVYTKGIPASLKDIAVTSPVEISGVEAIRTVPSDIQTKQFYYLASGADVYEIYRPIDKIQPDFINLYDQILSTFKLIAQAR